MMRRRSRLAAPLLLGLCVSLRLGAQQDRAKPVALDLAASAVARVKAAYYTMDYAGGVQEADRALARFPKSRELAAWRVANLARSDRPREAEAAATALLAANRNDAWGWFARTLYLEYADPDGQASQILQASAEAYRRAPTHADIIWMRAMAFSGNREPAQALALIDSVEKRGGLTQPLRNLRGNAMYGLATMGRTPNQARVDSAFALYAAARNADPADPATYVFASSRMLGAGKNTEGYDLARKGAELAPTSLQAHENYWRAIDGMRDRTQAVRDSESRADIESLLRARGGEPQVLRSTSQHLKTRNNPERARELEEKVLAEHGSTLSAEWVLVDRYRTIQDKWRDTTTRDSAITRQYIAALWEFVGRPTHVHPRLIGDAYRNLAETTDSSTNADTLLKIVRGMVKYEGINPHVVYAGGAIRLADRGRDFKEADQMTRDGLKEAKKRIDEQKEIYETVGDYARAVDWMSAFMYDARGYVFLRQGKLDSAEHTLKHALDLDPKSVSAHHHLGQLAEKRGRLEDAEQAYVKGSLLAAIGSNPNRAALERVYKARHGSLDGYPAYLAGLAETDRANRKADVAKSRLASLVALKPFEMKTLDGRVVSRDSLRGKVAVINNWGMWCGPCVAELPEFQKLADAYAGDSGVRILTIDNDPNTDALRSWMEKKKFTFTTLLDDGYIGRANIHSFPTTWFLDREGRIVFQKSGWSEKLVEEFGWRIDMIRQPKALP